MLSCVLLRHNLCAWASTVSFNNYVCFVLSLIGVKFTHPKRHTVAVTFRLRSNRQTCAASCFEEERHQGCCHQRPLHRQRLPGRRDSQLQCIAHVCSILSLSLSFHQRGRPYAHNKHHVSCTLSSRSQTDMYMCTPYLMLITFESRCSQLPLMKAFIVS